MASFRSSQQRPQPPQGSDENPVWVGIPITHTHAAMLRVHARWAPNRPDGMTRTEPPAIVCRVEYCETFQKAVMDAVFAACTQMEDCAAPREQPTEIVFEVPDGVPRLEGPSVGLGVALATLASHPQTSPRRRKWVHGGAASGTVSRSGAVGKVGRIDQKVHSLDPLWTHILVPAEGNTEWVSDNRVTCVPDLQTAWQNFTSRRAFGTQQYKMWVELDRKLPTKVPPQKAWLNLPDAVRGWTAWQLRAAPRLTVIHGPERSGRSRVLRHAADLLHRAVFIERQAHASDDLLQYAHAPTDPIDDLPPGTGTLWLFWENPDLTEVHRRLEQDPRIRIFMTTTWPGALQELGKERQAVEVLPYGTPDRLLSEEGERQLRQLTPWSQALVRSDVRNLDCLRRWQEVGDGKGPRVLWLHRLLAHRARAQAGSGPLAAELAVQLQHLLLYELHPAEFPGINIDPAIPQKRLKDAIKDYISATGDDDRGETWYDEYEEEFTPDEDELADHLAWAFLSCPLWREHRKTPNEKIWLLARIPELRPVLADLLAEATCHFLKAPKRFRSISEPIDLLMAAPERSGARSDDARWRDEVLLCRLVVRASWRCFDVRPMAGTTLLWGLWKHHQESRADHLVDYAREITEQVLFAPRSLTHLLHCADSVRELLHATQRVLRTLGAPAKRVQQFKAHFAPLDDLLDERNGGVGQACAQLDARVADTLPDPTDLVEHLDCWQHDTWLDPHCAYMAACWVPWSTPPPQGVLCTRMGQLYDHLWSHRKTLLQHAHIAMLIDRGHATDLERLLHRYRWELTVGGALPWMAEARKRWLRLVEAAENQLGGSHSSDLRGSGPYGSLEAYERAYEAWCFGAEFTAFSFEE